MLEERKVMLEEVELIGYANINILQNCLYRYLKKDRGFHTFYGTTGRSP